MTLVALMLWGRTELGGANIISGIIIGLVVAEMFYTFIVRRNWVIRLPDSVPASVSRSFFCLNSWFYYFINYGNYLLGISALRYTHFHQIILDSISTPLASLGSVVGWAYVILPLCCGSFGIHGSLALAYTCT